MARRTVRVALAIAGLSLLLMATPVAAESDGKNAAACDPLIWSVDLDLQTFPPTIRPHLEFHPECVPG